MARDELDLASDPPRASHPEWRPIETPTASVRDNELLTEIPQTEHHRGRLAGYGAGRGARRALLASLAVMLIVTTVVWYQWAAPRATASRQFQLPAGTDLASRPRTLSWSEGKARLGLSREPPGVDTVDLPDRTLRLADGSDLAQFKVVVEAGKTTALEVVSGAVVEELKPGAEPLLTR